MTLSQSSWESLRLLVTLAVVCVSGCGEQRVSQEISAPAAPPQLTRESPTTPPDSRWAGGEPLCDDSEPATLGQPPVVAAVGLEETVPANSNAPDNVEDEVILVGGVRDSIADDTEDAAVGVEPAELPPDGALPLPPGLTADEPVLEGPAFAATASERTTTDAMARATVPIAADDPPPVLPDAPARVPPPANGDSQSKPGTSGSGARSLSDQEPLFEGWPKPTLALVFTGQQWGFLEPCGCSGLENQKGGLARRSTLLSQLRGKGWPVVPIDAGNQVRRFGRQSEIKFQVTVDGLRKMGYRAIGFGPDDLRLPGTELVPFIAPMGDEPSPFVCANVTVLLPEYTSPFLVIEEAGKKIGITSVLGERNQKLINNDEITLGGSAEGLNDVWPQLQQARCDLYVLIAHATMEESIALAKKFPQFSLVASTGGAGEPTLDLEKVEGTHSQMLQIGTKGMYACVVGLFDDANRPLRYQRVPLDARFPDSAEMLQQLAAYQDQLIDAGFDGLGIKAQPHPSGRTFAGSASCADCHANAWKVWKEGLKDSPPKHSHAYATLQKPPKRSNIPRNFDPECISCHVVGWNPQKYFPYKSGFVSLESTPELTDVGCENCHGPGAEHVAAEDGLVQLTESQIDQLRKDLVLSLKDAEQTCLECHDLDNSPAFQEEGAFQRYWEKVKHGKVPARK